MVELGLQTIFDDTARAFNRGYNFDIYIQAVTKLRKNGIHVCTHIINGLPGETPEMMMQTARTLAAIDIQGIKIHLLNVLRGTPIAETYTAGKLQLFERDEYVSLVCDQLEVLPPGMVIHRLTADGPRDKVIGPLWSIKKWETLNAIDKELEVRDSWQGKFYKHPTK